MLLRVNIYLLVLRNPDTVHLHVRLRERWKECRMDKGKKELMKVESL